MEKRELNLSLLGSKAQTKNELYRILMLNYIHLLKRRPRFILSEEFWMGRKEYLFFMLIISI